MKKLSFLFISIFYLLFTNSIILYAGDVAPYLYSSYQADICGMGGASSSMSDVFFVRNTVGVNYNNPASAKFLSNKYHLLLTSAPIPDDGYVYNFVGNSMATKFGIFGVNWINYSNSNAEFPTYKANSVGVSYSFGLKILGSMIDNLAIGTRIRYTGEKYTGRNELGWGCDLGAIFQPMPLLSTGILFQDPYNKIGDRRFPFNTRLGFALIPFVQGLTIAFDLNQDFTYGNTSANFGAEYWIYKKDEIPTIATRAGINGRTLTTGLGIRDNVFKIDYAFLYNTKEKSKNHYFSAGIRWGERVIKNTEEE